MTRHNPWNLGPRFQEDIRRFYEGAQDGESTSAMAAWIPPVDIAEYPDRFELYVDLPGVDPAKVDLTLEGGVLTMSGEKSDPAPCNGQEEHEQKRVERSQGRFYRRFLLPDTVDSERVNATGKHGVLMISIPKQAKAMPRRIQIGS